MPDLRLKAPVGYIELLNLMANARLVLTDQGAEGLRSRGAEVSGGLPCSCTPAPPRPGTSAQLRENTERPVTVTEGTNRIVGNAPQHIISEVLAVLDGEGKAGRTPDLWDGRAAERIVAGLRTSIQTGE